MCGIAGIFNWTAHDSRDAMKTVERMTARLARRGPDSSGVTTNGGCTLGHRRLSIIDLSPRGAQPMTDETGETHIIFNGEIYNYRALKTELERAGHKFKSGSDTEVLLRRYNAHADDLTCFLDGVRGMFAFAIWDARRQRLVLGRDPLGIKPLVYYQGADFIAFASDLDALTECAEVPRRLDFTSLYDYLNLLTVPAPHTIYKNVNYLMPGTLLIVEADGRARELTYWQLATEQDAPLEDEREADELIETTLRAAVREHLVADVEVGAFLSGGIDSGLITALAATEATPQTLQTFCVAFPGAAENEGIWASEAAQSLGTRHHEFAVTGGFFDEFETIVTAMDQPLALPSALSLWQIARLARHEVKVVLTGDGGDELFAGYNRHRPYPAPSARLGFIPESLRPRVGRFGVKFLPENLSARVPSLAKLRGAATALARDETALYLPRLMPLEKHSPQLVGALFRPEQAAEIDAERYARRVAALFARCNYRDPLSRRLYVDLHTTLADEMLAKVDRMTMAHGLEARVPLLDQRVVETAMRVAGKLKRRNATGKLPLRRLVAKHLGAATAARKKHGFNSPLADWLQHDTATRARFNELWRTVEATEIFEAQQLTAARIGFGTLQGFTAHNLFALAVFGVWLQQRKVVF